MTCLMHGPNVYENRLNKIVSFITYGSFKAIVFKKQKNWKSIYVDVINVNPRVSSFLWGEVGICITTLSLGKNTNYLNQSTWFT